MMDLTGGALVLLTLAGFVAGAINAAAGGGSLVTFPALVAVGYPPLIANVTNNVAVSPGYVTGAWGYRGELRGQRRRIVPLAVVSTLGSIVGVGLILVSSQRAFEGIVPFLILAACALLAAQPVIGRWVGERASTHERPGIGSLVGQTLASAYGVILRDGLGRCRPRPLGRLLRRHAAAAERAQGAAAAGDRCHGSAWFRHTDARGLGCCGYRRVGIACRRRGRGTLSQEGK
jgi:uncharacterized protein